MQDPFKTCAIVSYSSSLVCQGIARWVDSTLKRIVTNLLLYVATNSAQIVRSLTSRRWNTNSLLFTHASILLWFNDGCNELFRWNAHMSDLPSNKSLHSDVSYLNKISQQWHCISTTAPSPVACPCIWFPHVLLCNYKPLLITVVDIPFLLLLQISDLLLFSQPRMKIIIHLSPCFSTS